MIDHTAILSVDPILIHLSFLHTWNPAFPEVPVISLIHLPLLPAVKFSDYRYAHCGWRKCSKYRCVPRMNIPDNDTYQIFSLCNIHTNPYNLSIHTTSLRIYYHHIIDKIHFPPSFLHLCLIYIFPCLCLVASDDKQNFACHIVFDTI